MTQPLQRCGGCCDWNGCPRSRPPPGKAMGPRANKHQVYVLQINTGWSSPGRVSMQTHCTCKSASTSQLYIHTRVASANSRHAAVAVETCSHSEGIRREAGCSLAPLTSLTNWLLYVSGSVRRTGRRWGRRQKNRWIISFAHPGGGSLTHTHMCSSTCDISSMQKKNLLLRWPAELGANEGQGEEERGVGGDERLPEEAR